MNLSRMGLLSSGCAASMVFLAAACGEGVAVQGAGGLSSGSSYDTGGEVGSRPDAGRTADAGTPGGRDGGGTGPCAESPDCCIPGSSRPCVTGCGSTGTQSCLANWAWDGCAPPAETCNGKDDNCDGQVDEGCPPPPPPPQTHDCKDQNVGHCNGDMGYGDQCAASDNVNGCTAESFWAWCNRRNTAYPNIWDDFVKSWVTTRCDGQLNEDAGQYTRWWCQDSHGDTWQCTTPLVLSFDGEPVRFAPALHDFAFEPSRGPRPTDLPGAETPWLALDRNDNGVIDDGRELFGSASPLAKGGVAKNGFEALAELDDNGDGRVDLFDRSFDRLLLWRDLNRDGISQPGELVSAAAAGLVRIELGFVDLPRCDARGNCERERASFLWRDALGTLRAGTVSDVHLRYQPGSGDVASR